MNKNTTKKSLQCLAEQTSQLNITLNSGMFATLINALLLIIVLWPVIDHRILLIWLTVLIIVSFVRVLTAYQYKQLDRSEENTLLWYHRFIAGSVAGALVWTAATVWLFPMDDLARQVFLAFIIGGLAAGAVTNLSYSKLAIYNFLIITLVPLVIRFFFSDTELGVAMSSMLALYLLMLLITATRTHTNLKQNIVLKIDSVERERSLQQSEHRYEKILETASDAFFLHNMQGHFIDVNKFACSSLGYTRDELLNLSVPDVEINHDPEIFAHLRLKLEKGENIRVNGVHRRKDDSTFPIEASISMIQMNNENMVSVFARNVTERHRVDEMKNEFISSVSHELQTPLTAIRGSLGLLIGGYAGELPDKVSEMIKIAGNNTERLIRLINDILDLQKIESGKMDFSFDTIDVETFLKQAIESNSAYGDEYGVKFIINTLVPEAKLYVDRNRLMQVMSNLLSNAAKFSNKNKEVEININRIDNDYLRISITDHGLGIPDEYQPKIFDKFTQSDSSDTRQRGGTGLGLSISKLIVENLNGKISFISAKNVGSTFYVDLPELKDDLLTNSYLF